MIVALSAANAAEMACHAGRLAMRMRKMSDKKQLRQFLSTLTKNLEVIRSETGLPYMACCRLLADAFFNVERALELWEKGKTSRG